MVRPMLLLFFSLSSLLMLPSTMKLDTSSIILYVRVASPGSSIWPLLSPDTQIPFLRPGAVFVATAPWLLFLRGMGWWWWWWAIPARADFLPLILTGYSTTDRICFAGPIANSCKLTIWRQQLRATKGLKIRGGKAEAREVYFGGRRGVFDNEIQPKRALKHHRLEAQGGAIKLWRFWH